MPDNNNEQISKAAAEESRVWNIHSPKGTLACTSIFTGKEGLGEFWIHSLLCPGWLWLSAILMASLNCHSFLSTWKWLETLKAVLLFRKSNLPDVLYLSSNNTLWLRPASPITSYEKGRAAVQKLSLVFAVLGEKKYPFVLSWLDEILWNPLAHGVGGPSGSKTEGLFHQIPIGIDRTTSTSVHCLGIIMLQLWCVLLGFLWGGGGKLKAGSFETGSSFWSKVISPL